VASDSISKDAHLEEIGEQCLKLDASLKVVVDDAVPLTEYAWRFRYPGEIDALTEDEANRALAHAQAVYDAVLGRLPMAVNPQEPSGAHLKMLATSEAPPPHSAEAGRDHWRARLR